MIVVDTHALVWWVNGGRSGLSQTARTAINREQRDGEIAISAISAWEIALLAARGRLALTMNVDLWLAHVARVNRVRFVPVKKLGSGDESDRRREKKQTKKKPDKKKQDDDLDDVLGDEDK